MCRVNQPFRYQRQRRIRPQHQLRRDLLDLAVLITHVHDPCRATALSRGPKSDHQTFTHRNPQSRASPLLAMLGVTARDRVRVGLYLLGACPVLVKSFWRSCAGSERRRRRLGGDPRISPKGRETLRRVVAGDLTDEFQAGLDADTEVDPALSGHEPLD